MTGDKTKQLLHILEWQPLVVSGPDNDKIDAIVQSSAFCYKFGCSGKDNVERFNFSVQIIRDVKRVKEFQEKRRYVFLLFFLGSFHLVLLLPNATLRSQGGKELQ